jgi:hypothetical protein
MCRPLSDSPITGRMADHHWMIADESSLVEWKSPAQGGALA